ncbi:MAG: hypothetical protein IKS49_02710 [Actinomycetaceae bacterium]|nr:hypothetical protein [Actinomycetaceae bacterium]
MSNSGSLVREILREATVPASRPIDHARRIGTAFFLGSIGGVILGIGALPALPSMSSVLKGLLAMLAFGALCLSPWALKPKGRNSIPVVARVLATKELPAARRSKGGGVLVPVVCRPCVTSIDNVDGDGQTKQSRDQDFRAVVVVHSKDTDNPVDPPVGTLLPLVQVEPGMGELIDVADEDVTPAQRELMERLEANPKIMRNRAPVLPLRRGALERVPAWAAVEFWLSALFGAIALAWAISHLFV